jgi:hypothetical protein
LSGHGIEIPIDGSGNFDDLANGKEIVVNDLPGWDRHQFPARSLVVMLIFLESD